MASEQMTRRRDNDDKDVEKDRVSKMTSHFETLASGEEANKGPTTRSTNTTPHTEENKSHEFVSLSDKASDDEHRDHRKEKTEDQQVQERGDQQPTLEDISKARAQAQQKSTEAIRAAEDRYNKALEAAKQKGSEAAGYVGDKAAAARDVTVETGKEAAGRAGEAAVSVKDRAVAAGWTAAHYSTEKAVEGTMAAARVVKGAADKAVEIAAKPLAAAKDAAVSAGESAKEYTYRKKDEAQRDLDAKQMGTTKQETEEKKEEYYSPTEHSSEYERPREQSGSVLGAIGETIVEIAQTTRDLVIGEDKHDQDRTTDRS